MANVDKINISLPREMNAFVQEVVAAGEYATVSEVMRDALRALKYERIARDVALAELREEVRKGFESGPATDFSFDRLIEKVRAAKEK